MKLKLKELRKRAGLSQEEMAAQLGIKTSRYGTWERGERMLSLAQAYDCAVVLHCSIDEIAGREVPRAFSSELERELNRTFDQLSPEGQEVAVNVVAGMRDRYPKGDCLPGVVEGSA